MSENKGIQAQIDLKNAEHNFREIQRITNGADIIAVVKANAYGHGACELSRLYESLGAKVLAVARFEEALEIRGSGVTLPILIFGYTSPALVPSLIENNFSQTVFSRSYAEALSEEAEKCGKKLSVHIKLDTGMTRMGIYAHQKCFMQAADEVYKICLLGGLSPDGIFTHFAESEVSDSAFTDEQFESFSETVSELSRRGISFKFCHCANSAGVLNYKKTHLRCVRPGLALYGLNPGVRNLEDVDLRPVMTLSTVIADVRDIRAGDTVSYNRHFTAPRDMRIAVIAAGYADGVPRALSNRASFLIHGRRAQILGNVCMDLIVLDVTNIPEASRGDEVIIFGTQGGELLPVEELSDLAGTITYEILTSVAKRVVRTYTQRDA